MEDILEKGKKEEFYNKRVEDVLRELKTGINGLSNDGAVKRLEEYGKNVIKEKKKISKIKIFINQFNSIVIWILIAATIISFATGEMLDAIVILAILLINAVLGFFQEYRAETTIEKLKKMLTYKARVIRNGEVVEINSEDVVVGDILILEEGDKVPADARIIESNELNVDESILTGESVPVSKFSDVINGKKSIADQKNMVFSGTSVTRGDCRAVVVSTGMNTEVGKIAHMIQEQGVKFTPLQKKLDKLGKNIGLIVIAIAVVVFLGSLLKHEGRVLDLFITAIALAVAAIPEGLPAVVTICLSLGIQRMAKRNALVRKLPSVETLGSTTVICADKTGTLTHNQMTVTKLYIPYKVVSVSGRGYLTKGEFSTDKNDIEMLLRIGLLCNDSFYDKDKNEFIGDPTEISLIVSGMKSGLDKDKEESKFKRVALIPFTSDRKMMTTINLDGGDYFVFTKGAPEILLNKCDSIYVNGKIERLTNSTRNRILNVNNEFCSSALRVLGFAYKKIDKNEFNQFKLKKDEGIIEKDLIFVGLQAMIDPPREDAKIAIKKCEDAGIRVVMITGDNKETAIAIAKEMGIKGEAITGVELNKMSDDELYDRVDDISIYARINPLDKIRIINALKKKGNIVAMTGDGVNDAPALKKADIGVAVGSGTDVAKEAADMILTNDNFASIVNAVEDGRGIYDNIKKFVNYLLSCNLGEVLIIFFAILFGLPLPLIAIQILWVNLVTDGLPAVALSVDPLSPNVMKRKPRDPKQGIITKNMLLNIISIGVLMTIASLLLFVKYLGNIEVARTVVFTTVVLLEMVRIYMVRSQYKIKFFSNRFLISAIALSVVLQLAVIYTPLRIVFKTVPLGIEWIYIIIALLVVFGAGVLLSKLIRFVTKEVD